MRELLTMRLHGLPHRFTKLQSFAYFGPPGAAELVSVVCGGPPWSVLSSGARWGNPFIGRWHVVNAAAEASGALVT